MDDIEYGAIHPVSGLPFIGRRAQAHRGDSDLVISIKWDQAGIPPNPNPQPIDGTELGLSTACELVAVGRQDDPDLHRTIFWMEVRDTPDPAIEEPAADAEPPQG